MANEAQLQVTLQYTKSGIAAILASGSVSRDVAGTACMRNVQNVGTGAEALLLGDVGTPGLCIIHNLDPTNYVEVLPSVTDPACLKVLPGDWLLVRFGAAAPALKANTAACLVEVFLLPA